MKSFLFNLEEVSKKILENKILILAGDEDLLSKLPQGRWIAGTIPYYMDIEGGVKTKKKIFVTDITHLAKNVNIKTYEVNELKNLASNYYGNGFSYIIIPSFSVIHTFYAENCYLIKNIFTQPLIGWISGFDLDDKTKIKGKVFTGLNIESLDSKAVVMHVELIEEIALNMGTINLFEPGNGEIINFKQIGFKITNCIINEKEMSFAKYLLENEIDTSLPLVSYFDNKKVNVSIKEVNLEEDYVEFYAPVFSFLDYQIASPVGLYEMEFEEALRINDINPVLSCNCILNYLYASLEGKKTGGITGPITFGEIAHVLLNQTMVYLELKKK